MIHELAAGQWRLLVDAQHGARVLSLQVAGREWLSASGHDHDAAGTFVRPGLGGWDEVLPTVADCSVEPWGRLGDHGGVWNVPWEVAHLDASSIVTIAATGSPPLRMARTLSLSEAGLEVSYELENVSAVAVPWLWTAHLLFAAPPATAVRALDGTGPPIEEWPRQGATRDVLPATVDSLAPGSAMKVFVPGARRASITLADGTALAVACEGLPASAVGLLWDRGLWAAGDVVAVEPSNAATDRASDLPLSRWLGPRETAVWRVSIAVMPRAGTLESRMSWPGDRVVLRDPEERPGSAGQGDG